MSTDTPSEPGEAKPAKPGRLRRLGGALNVILPVREIGAVYRQGKATGSAINDAAGALRRSVATVSKLSEADAKPTEVEASLKSDPERRAGAVLGARVRWLLGVVLVGIAVRQLALVFFTTGGFLAVANTLISAVVCALLGAFVAMVALRDAHTLIALSAGGEPVTNREVLKSPSLWIPW